MLNATCHPYFGSVMYLFCCFCLMLQSFQTNFYCITTNHKQQTRRWGGTVAPQHRPSKHSRRQVLRYESPPTAVGYGHSEGDGKSLQCLHTMPGSAECSAMMPRKWHWVRGEYCTNTLYSCSCSCQGCRARIAVATWNLEACQNEHSQWLDW